MSIMERAPEFGVLGATGTRPGRVVARFLASDERRPSAA